MRTLLSILLAAWVFSASPVFADPEESGGTGTLVSKTENRTITTSETRKTNPDGSTSGTFTQIIKGKNNPEKLTLKGSMSKVDDKEVFTLEETGKTHAGLDVENVVTITRDLVGGVLIEKLTRKSKRKRDGVDEKQELGGLPATVITSESPDGSKQVKIFNDPGSDLKIPDLTFDIPADKPTVLSVPPLDIFVAVTPPVTGPGPGPGSPPGGSPPTIPPVANSPSATIPPVVTTPPGNPPPVVVTPPAVVTPPVVTPPITCFVAGTLVQTPAGKRSIESIQVGDQVLALSDKTGKLESFSVTRLIQGERSDLYKVTVNGHSILCSQNHPFKTIRGIVKASNLLSTDKILRWNGTSVEECPVQSQPHFSAQPIGVFSFEVSDGQKTIMVGEDWITVGAK